MKVAPADDWMIMDMGLVDYRHAHDLQLRLLAARIDKRLGSDLLLLLEHHPVFTLGRRGGRANLMVDDTFLNERGIEVIQVERGGDITFHGPGQIVLYLLIDLRECGLDIRKFVRSLESVMIHTAADFGVRAERDARNAGIWVEGKKLGSIGIAIRRGITFHGIALNVNIDLVPFQWINPCGLSGVSMSSLQKESSVPVAMHQVKTSLFQHLQTVFGKLPVHVSNDMFSSF